MQLAHISTPPHRYLRGNFGLLGDELPPHQRLPLANASAKVVHTSRPPPKGRECVSTAGHVPVIHGRAWRGAQQPLPGPEIGLHLPHPIELARHHQRREDVAR
ncbi:hypothetical protein D9M72_651060 [compost metagenome]